MAVTALSEKLARLTIRCESRVCMHKDEAASRPVACLLRCNVSYSHKSQSQTLFSFLHQPGDSNSNIHTNPTTETKIDQKTSLKAIILPVARSLRPGTGNVILEPGNAPQFGWSHDIFIVTLSDSSKLIARVAKSQD